MRSLLRIVFSIYFIVMTAFFLIIHKADAEEGTCVLEASKDVFVMVWDLDKAGNKGRQIWQGRINQGETAKITAPHARLRYSYNDQPDEDQPLSGGIDRWCNNLNTVLVP